VNVTLLPAQVGLVPDVIEILTLGTTLAVTTIVTLLVAVAGLAQAALDVMVTVTTSLFANEGFV
jgi:hypothetical protein